MTAFFCDDTAPVLPDQYNVEFTELLDMYRALRPQTVLEIGIRRGGTLYQWIKHATEGARIIAVDLPNGPWLGTPIAPPVDDWIGWAADRSVNLFTILGNSHTPRVVRDIEERGPYDFIFIDGDHSFTGVACDFLTYSRMVRPGGLVVLHDILPDQSDNKIQVWKFWKEITTAGYKTREIVSDTKQPARGLGVVYV